MAGIWPWLLQRFSAVLLLWLVAAHFSVMHVVDPDVKLTFAGSVLRFQAALYLVVDGGLLLLGLFHGLNGLRSVILDYWPRAAGAATWLLSLLGAAFAGYGMAALAAFVRG